MTGMGLGMLLAHITRGHALSVWASFLSLTVFHMYANYKAVESLSLTTLNCERASILLQYFKECSEGWRLQKQDPTMKTTTTFCWIRKAVFTFSSTSRQPQLMF
jgi:hypothetical protein